MTTRVLVKPAEGRLVRNPDTYEALPAEGKAIEMNSYWQRRLMAGDIVIHVPESRAVKPNEGKR
ncbi:hypothetical protein PS3A_03190 [Pseudomonas sp. 3A(2025)]